jgi:4-hydroxybenzoate polyprenyltransferase
MGLFQRYPAHGPQSFTLAYKFEIRDENENELTESEEIIEEVNPANEEIENYTNQLAVIFTHASFLFLLLLIREMIKDLENLKGDLANNYKTIPIVYGENSSKKIITALTFCTVIPVYILIEIYDVGYMDIYFYSCLIVLIYFLLRLQKATNKQEFLRLHNVLKLLIVAGVFCIVLINPSVVWHGKRWLF